MEASVMTMAATPSAPIPAIPVKAARKHTRKGSLRTAAAKDSTENIRARARKNGSVGQISSDGSSVGNTPARSAGRGREFTVGNVGNNGMIYLRPLVRPGNQRSPATPQFTFPLEKSPTSPTPSGESRSKPVNDINGSFFTGSRPHTATSPTKAEKKISKDDSQLPTVPPLESLNHVRSRSFSNGDEHAQKNGTDNGTFKVVIHRPSVRRPKTADSTSFPMLEVPIPHYRLGTPRFNSGGTLVLRSSAYTGTSVGEDFRLSNSSRAPKDRQFSFGSPGIMRHSLAAGLSNAAPRQRRNTHRSLDNHVAMQPNSSSSSTQGFVDMRVYDRITMDPDDPTEVRYAPGTKNIVAASPPRLIAHITSSDFLDYELLSDFFLTFRSYLPTIDLAAYLIARLRWAVEGSHDSGRIVRVRTFVALRHWILNYFIDDFVPDYQLRQTFCGLVNRLHQDLRKRSDQGAHDAKIIGELKKCWRRTCGLFWDDPSPLARDSVDNDILPGGWVGSRDSGENQIPVGGMVPYYKRHSRKPSSKDTGKPTAATASTTGRSYHVPQHSITSGGYSGQENDVPLSPGSDGSLQVLSCSIPMRTMHKTEAGSTLRLHPHPVPMGHRRNPSVTSPTRPGGSHKRSGSFSDALRDAQPPASPGRSPVDIEQFSYNLAFPGSLIRGGLVQPESPYFELGSTHAAKAFIVHADASFNGTQVSSQEKLAAALHNPGVKRLLGSVRRALSTKPDMALASRIAHREDFDQSMALHKTPKTTTVAQRSRAKPARPQVRVDLLMAKIHQSFNLATRAEAATDGQGKQAAGGFQLGITSPSQEAFRDPHQAVAFPDGQRLNSNFTTGSRSIVIVDDTGSAELYLMSGALPGSKERKLDVEQILPVFLPSPTNDHDQKPIHEQEQNTATTGAVTLNNLVAPVQSSPKKDRTTASTTRDHQIPTTALGQAGLSGRQYSIDSTRTSGTVLRKFASFHSGESRCTPGHPYVDSMARSSEDDPFFLEKQPARPLRRRPAADLRAAHHAQDIETPPLQRTRSAGALSSHLSLTGPVNIEDSTGDETILAPRAYSRSQEPQQEPAPKRRKSLSLVDTHSSQPNLRPSFQAEVAKLAALPDDEDDGGIESTLLKLEGKYDPRRRPEEAFLIENDHSPNSSYVGSPLPPFAPEVGDHQTPRESQIGELPKRDAVISVKSEDSYSSVPLLERGLSTRVVPTRAIIAADPTELTTTVTLTPTTTKTEGSSTVTPYSSLEHVTKTESMGRIPKDGTLPHGMAAHRSFLLNDEEELSEDSGELVEPEDDTSQGVRSFYDDGNDMDDDLPSHPFRHASNVPAQDKADNPPAYTENWPSQTSPSVLPGLFLPSNQSNSTLQPPPATTGRKSPTERQFADKPGVQKIGHLPFILSYDAEFLVQQFTIIEKDALDEIDWKELIELRWKQTSTPIYDWVDFLRSQESRGVDVVIARFNLMTKWALSEIVLCENLEERVSCIIQYIHIAAHARRIRNYATMYQITLALVSSDCTRLKRTWTHVPAAEMAMMKELEALVQPTRNFYNLRMEMETAHADGGCIPFIGIYTRDLIYNAQKPAFITSPPNNDHPLVNFERHHTAATIVKSLLRLLEASTKYDFQPDPTSISRCLWMAALGDDEIASLSRKLE